MISFLKNDAKFTNLGLYFVAFLILLSILKKVLKAKNGLPIFFDYTIKTSGILFCLLLFGNVMINENYSRLLYLIFAFFGGILVIKLPILLKWYDDKVDDFFGRK